AALVYLEHQRRPAVRRPKGVSGLGKGSGAKSHRAGALSSAKAAIESSESEDSDSEESDTNVPPHRRQIPYFYRRRGGKKGHGAYSQKSKAGSKAINLMLPTLLPGV
ncbi:unnamed protein product, partial [Polarella glacialis]